VTRAEALAAIPAGDPWRLMGPATAKRRAQSMGAIIGRKATQAESGVTAIRDTLIRQLGITGDCIAQRADRLAEAIHQQAAPRGEKE
jgi:hypothetical protein